MARPTKYSQELAVSICEQLCEGVPLTRICKQEGMPSFGTVWRWEQENAEFRELSMRAREVGTHYLANECIEIADDGANDTQTTDEGLTVVNHDVIQRARLRIDTRLRLIGKWNAKKYGDKLEVDNKGEVKHTISFKE